MKCMNCGEELTQRTSDFTLKVLLCKSCAMRVDKLKRRLRSELETLLATLDDTMRFGITSQVQLPAEDDDVNRQYLLEFIVRLDADCRSTTRASKSDDSQLSKSSVERPRI